jgi:hypothetical protein
VYSSGKNVEGQLGLGHRRTRPHVPHLITELDGHKIVQVACGDFHSAALTDSGALFTWCALALHGLLHARHGIGLTRNACHRGNGLYGQLGHSSETSSATPLLVHACEGLRVVYVACGAYHTVAIIGTVPRIGTCPFARTELTATRSLSSACAQRAVTCWCGAPARRASSGRTTSATCRRRPSATRCAASASIRCPAVRRSPPRSRSTAECGRGASCSASTRSPRSSWTRTIASTRSPAGPTTWPPGRVPALPLSHAQMMTPCH